MSTSAKWSLGLWLLLAVVVFNVRFDWQTRMANHAFVGEQLARVKQGRPPLTINEGFRPMVREAAREASFWMLAIAASGAGATLAAGARYKRIT